VRTLRSTLSLLIRRPALTLALLALILRLLFVWVLDPSPRFEGGDTNWYMQNGRDLVMTGKTAGPLQTPPLYLLLAGSVQVLVPGGPDADRAYNEAEMQTLRTIQAFLGAALVACVTILGRRLFAARAGWYAGLVTAVSPALIVESGNLITESVFLALIVAGLTAYVLAQETRRKRDYVGAGALLALATLTRAVFLFFPLLLVAHLRLTRRRSWAWPALALLISYAALVSTWTVYNLAVWERLVIGGDGLLGFVYQGATGKASPQEVDERLGIDPQQDNRRDEILQERVRQHILDDPAGWAAHRLTELAGAILQPHNTVYFQGESVRDAAADWWRDDRSLDGLRDLTRTQSFWPKLSLYVFHYAGLVLGAAGMIASRRRWRDLLPLYELIAYFVGVHLVLLALPRYLFPTYPALWLFGAAWLAANQRLRPARPHTPAGAR
jgi:4-amino-4-deoxy-L-arabinose transferase-like glycosyltransferase